MSVAIAPAPEIVINQNVSFCVANDTPKTSFVSERHDSLNTLVKRSEVDETPWHELYPPLQSLARYLVNTLPLPFWRGREADIADDIVQETMRRIVERQRKALRGEAPPINSVRQMITTIAFNYYRDLKRHERRLNRMDGYDAYSGNSDMRMFCADMGDEPFDLDAIVERVDHEALFERLACEIKLFPKKQRRALLIDLANRMFFDTTPTPLQAAFERVGIELRNYQQALPESPLERSRHISLLSQAYKRVSRLDYKYA